MVHFSHLQRLSLTLTALTVAFGMALSRAQEEPAKEIEKPARVLEIQEASLNTEAAAARIKELQAQVEELTAKADNLSKALAQTNEESAQQTKDYTQMRLLMEALGVAAINGDERSLQTRLLDAVNDFRISQKTNQALTAQLVEISEASIAYLKSSDAESRKRLESVLAAGSQQLKKNTESANPTATPLGEAKVVSFKSDLGLAVVNAGKLSGLRLGMPVHFVRKDRSVAKGVIVDCREQITGILITAPAASGADSVVVGDLLTLEPTQPSAQ